LHRNNAEPPMSPMGLGRAKTPVRYERVERSSSPAQCSRDRQ